MGWQNVGESAGGQDFLKIEAGKKVKIHVLSEEPHSFFQHFFNSIQRGAVCPGEGCPACATNEKDNRKRMQHSMVVVTEDGQVKVWTMGNKVAEQLKNIYETYQGLGDVDLVIVRTGTGMETKYGVTPVPTAIDFSAVDMDALPDLGELNPVASIEDIDSMLQGVDPGFAAKTAEPAAEEEAAPAEEAPPAEEEAAPAPAPKPVAKPAAKPAPAKAGVTKPATDPRMPLVKEIMGLLATHPKYKTQQAKAALFKACAPGKATMSVMTVADLTKVRNTLKTK